MAAVNMQCSCACTLIRYDCGWRLGVRVGGDTVEPKKPNKKFTAKELDAMLRQARSIPTLAVARPMSPY